MQTNAKTAGPGAERKRPDRKPKKQAPARKAGPQTAQQTIPYREIFKDGICLVNDRLYTKSMEYEDINYQLAQADDQSAIFDGYCAFLNSFDSSLPFQLSFINHRRRTGTAICEVSMWKCWKARLPRAITALCGQSC